MLLPLGILASAGGAALADYELISTTVLGSSAASVTFSGLGTSAAAYKHLQIRAVARTTVTADLDNVTLQLNGDTAANYATHILYGDGSSVSSAAFTSANFIYLGSSFAAAQSSANIFGAGVVDILDFSSPSKNTTIRSLAGSMPVSAGNTKRVGLSSGLWNNIAAVTSITLANSANFVTGSRFSLYGLK